MVNGQLGKRRSLCLERRGLGGKLGSVTLEIVGLARKQ
jgi:hypothetical protein